MFRLVLLALSIVCTAPDLLGKARRSPLAGWHTDISPDREGSTGALTGRSATDTYIAFAGLGGATW